VVAGAEGYNPMADSEWINCGDTGLIDFQLHTTPMSRILLYYGNSGKNELYSDAEAMFQYMGYFVDYTDVWPTDPDLEEYKVIFLLGPGNENDDPASDYFTPAQITQLDLFLRNGGRLVVMAEDDEGVTTENTLLGQLNDLDVRFEDVASGVGNNILNAISDDITVDQLTGGVDTLHFHRATDLMVGAGADPGVLAELNASHTAAPRDMLAADIIPGISRLDHDGFAGDVVLIGDLDWMGDDDFMGTVEYDPITGDPEYVWPDYSGDNENLLLNIITF
jgi:hypothetical protein